MELRNENSFFGWDFYLAVWLGIKKRHCWSEQQERKVGGRGPLGLYVSHSNGFFLLCFFV